MKNHLEQIKATSSKFHEKKLEEIQNVTAIGKKKELKLN
jgi:hypothetical protein